MILETARLNRASPRELRTDSDHEVGCTLLATCQGPNTCCEASALIFVEVRIIVTDARPIV